MLFVKADVSKEEEVKNMVQTAVDTFGLIPLLQTISEREGEKREQNGTVCVC